MSIRKWPVIMALLLIAALAWPATGLIAEPAGVDSWTKRGPQHNIGGGVAPMAIQILFDGSNPSIVYAGTNQGVYRSTDGGETWQQRSQGLGGYGDLVITGLVMHPTNSQILYIGTWGYGLFRSTDSGANWARLTDPLAGGGQLEPAGETPEPPLVRAGGPSYTDGLPQDLSNLPEKGLPAPVLPAPREDGAGAGIEGTPNPLSWTPVRRIAINPSNASELFACIDSGRGLYYSPDGGTSWSKLDDPPGTGSARTYTFAPSNSQIRYASFGTWETSGGFYRTTNGGGTWTPVGGSTIAAPVTAVAIHPTNPDIVLAATSGGGLYRSSNGGDTWTPVGGSLSDDVFFSIAFAPSNPNIAYAGGLAWVYISTDGGLTWDNADATFPTIYVEGLAIHPTLAGTVLIGANYFPFGGVYKRTSSASPFVLKATGMEDTFVLDIEQDPNNANRLFAATWGAGVFRSDDGGTTWAARYGVPYVYSLKAVNSGGSTILYAGTFYDDWGVLRSPDLGDSWEDISGGQGYSSNISFDLESAGSGLSRLVAATKVGVEYSDDGGVSWNDATGLNAGVVLRIARSPSNANKLLAATYGGNIWTSTNAGASWTETGSGLGSTYTYSVVFSPTNANVAYAGSYGVYRSTNGGASWSLFGVPDTWIRTLEATSGTHDDLFAGTHDKGVYMAPDVSGFWAPINTGLGDMRIRAVKASSANTLFAGTAGSSGWQYTIVTRPSPPPVYLPLVLRASPAPPGGWVTIKAENFEGTFPGAWEVKDNDPNNGYYYWGKRTCRPFAGSYSGWGVGGGAGTGLSCGSSYPIYVVAWMKYGPFSLADASDAELTFQYWLDTELTYDVLFYGASLNGNNFYGTEMSGNSAGWRSRELDLTAVPTLGNLVGQPNVWIAFVFVSDYSVIEPEGAYVDDIVLRKYVGADAGLTRDELPALPETMTQQDAVFSWSD